MMLNINISRELQVKNTGRYHYTPIRKVKIWKIISNVGENVEHLKLLDIAGGNVKW